MGRLAWIFCYPGTICGLDNFREFVRRPIGAFNDVSVHGSGDSHEEEENEWIHADITR